MKAGIIAFQHESNTFATTPTDLAAFGIRTGQQVRDHYAPSFHELAGFFESLDAAGIEAVPIFAAVATPSGTVTADAYDALLDQMLRELTAAGRLDGLLVAPHGAGVSEDHPDMDGHWLAKVRQQVGANVPMICTLDPHTNLSQAMIDACDATIAYRSNPHVDQKAIGGRAANLMVRTLAGQVRPVQAAAFPPAIINIERQLTSEPPCAPLYAFADEMLTRPGLLSNSITLGFPYADVPEMGTRFIAVADGDAALARACADELAGFFWQRRHEFVGLMISVEEAIREAETAAKPVCLLDMGDNVGGGAPGDGTIIAHALLAHGGLRSFATLYDPQAQQAAREAGAGATLRLAMGGRTVPLQAGPITVEVTVRSLHDGRYRETEPRHGGRVEYNMGPTAIVQTQRGQHGLTLMLTSRRSGSSSLNQLISCGLDPQSFDVLVAKGVHAPVAAYAPVCPTRTRVNTPGVTSADLNHFNFRHRQRPLFPFEAAAWTS